MRIRLKSFFHFDFSKAFGNDNVEFSEDATVRALLETLHRETGGVVDAIDQYSGGLDIDYFVLLNGRDMDLFPQGMETALHDGDEVAIGMNYHWGGG